MLCFLFYTLNLPPCQTITLCFWLIWAFVLVLWLICAQCLALTLFISINMVSVCFPFHPSCCSADLMFPLGSLKFYLTLFNFLLALVWTQHLLSLLICRAQSLSPTDHLAAFYLALQLAVSRQVMRCTVVARENQQKCLRHERQTSKIKTPRSCIYLTQCFLSQMLWKPVVCVHMRVCA